MTYKELYESAADKLEKSKITLGEFEKMIEPLNAEIDTDSDTISRQAAIDTIEDFPHGDVWNVESMEEMVDRIKQLPSAQPERIKGRWISADAIFGGEPFYCSECGENTRDTVMGKPRWNFCPNCGADMRGEQDDKCRQV